MTHEKTHINVPKNNGKNKLCLWLYKMGYINPPKTDANLAVVIDIPIAKAKLLSKNHFDTKVY